MPHISIKAEILFTTFGFPFTNSYLASLIVIGSFALLAWYYHNELKKERKGDIFYVLQFILKTLYSFFGNMMGNKIDVFFTIIAAFFIYILIQNWFGLLPGVGSIVVHVKEAGKVVTAPLLRGNNADLNTTVALATISVFLIQFFGIKYLGFFGYMHKFINIKSPIDFFIGFLDIISEFSRVLSFAFRLFGNIFAGEVLLTIVAFLVPVLASFPFLMLELFVGAVQALVFSMLTAMFFNMAIQKQH